MEFCSPICNRVLDLQPESVHDKCPIILGSPCDVRRVLSFYEETAQKAKEDEKAKA